MDGRTGLVAVCAATGGAWALLVLTLLAGRIRARRRRAPEVSVVETEWPVPREALGRIGLGDPERSEDETRAILLRALRSDEPELRLAGITTLGRLGDRHEWAIDGLVEALAEEIDNPARAAGQLDRLAPRAGARLPPLLGHPSSVVRFYAVRLLAGYEALAGRHVPRMTSDASPNVRAAALETLRAVTSGETLRCALRLLDDPHPLVRAHASRTAAAMAPLTAAPFLVPLLADRSWWVREAVREALVEAGPEVARAVEPLLRADDAMLRSGAALVLQDVGVIDGLVHEADVDQLERILDAGGPRLREAASGRARAGLRIAAAAESAAAAS